MSHHLKVLVDADLLTRDKRGVWAYYAIVPGALDVLADLLRTPVRHRPNQPAFEIAAGVVQPYAVGPGREIPVRSGPGSWRTA